MTTDFRALCAELVSAWDDLPWEYDFKGNVTGIHGDLYDDSAVDRARAALAEPKPERPTDEDLLDLHDWMTDEWAANHDFELPPIQYARAVLTRWGNPVPAPVPVSERLPEPEDCSSDGKCWWFCFECPGEHSYWIFAKEVYCAPTYWLPAHALPLPTANE